MTASTTFLIWARVMPFVGFTEGVRIRSAADAGRPFRGNLFSAARDAMMHLPHRAGLALRVLTICSF
jgi:hypothetical protein